MNISEKLHWQHLFEKLEEREWSPSSLLVQYNNHTHTLKNSIYHSNKRGPPPFFHSDSNPILGHVLVNSVDKIYALVLVVELIWLFLNMLSFNFVPTPNISLRFTRFRRSYVNGPGVVLIKITLLSCLVCAFESDNVSSFCNCLSSIIVHLRNLFLMTTSVTRMLLTPRRVSRGQDMKEVSINISKLKVAVKH